MKKRIIAIIAACVMLVTAFAGIAAAEEAEGGYKVGVNYFGPGSFALQSLLDNSVYAIGYIGDEALDISDNFQPEQIVSDIENMCNSGCDGIIVWLPIPALYTRVGEICEKYQVPFVLNDKIPTEEDVIAQLNENPYYVGAVSPDNYSYGKQIAEYALEKGYKTCVVSTSSIGDPTDTPRLDAFKETFEAGGGEILDVLYSETSSDAQSRLESSLIVNFPDFIYGTGSDYGIAAVGALNNLQMTGEVAVLTSGLDSQAVEYRLDGKIEYLTGDFWSAGYFSAVIMEAYLHGNQLLDADGKVPYFDNQPPFEVNPEDYDLYKTVFIDNKCYSQAETEALVNGTYDDVKNAFEIYSLEERAKAKVADGTIDASLLEAAGISAD